VVGDDVCLQLSPELRGVDGQCGELREAAGQLEIGLGEPVAPPEPIQVEHALQLVPSRHRDGDHGLRLGRSSRQRV
jgi:hypothetical protein